MGQNLSDHSYVNISTVGSANDNSDSVVCHTNLSTCCSGLQGIHRGNWSFPAGTVLPFIGPGVPIALGRGPQVAVIRRTTATGPTGIYRCDIATNEVHDDTDQSVGETLYVGLYPADGKLNLILSLFIKLYIHKGGDITISGGVMFDSDQMTLTCISTGGPATTVTWTRNSITITEGNETVLDDPVTAQYTHTLTVTTGGEHTCTVSNNKPSSDSANITVPGIPQAVSTNPPKSLYYTFLSAGASPPSNVTAVQDGPTSIIVSWTPPSSLGDTTGYRIHYTSVSDSGNETVSDGSTETHTLTGLMNGETYTISVVATSGNLPSESVTANMAVGLRKSLSSKTMVL